MSSPDDYAFFWKIGKEYGEFSQWYRSEFIVDDKSFATAEQFMMYSKAELFGDTKSMDAILKSPNAKPAQHKKMGRSVKPFDAKQWDDACLEIVTLGNIYKFTQDDELRDLLMSTEGKTIVEASPLDRIWGIGFGKDNAIAKKNSWGENKLGIALMRARNVIKCMIEHNRFQPITSPAHLERLRSTGIITEDGES